jgi:diguanylate cyclase (GGDEF)-like protein
MPAPTPQHPAEILILGAAGPVPAPLPELVGGGVIELRATGDLFTAAAMLREEGRRPMALLVDPERLSRGEMRKIVSLKRHLALPIWSLPTKNKQALISALGILPWEDAARALSQFLLQYQTHALRQGSTAAAPREMPPKPFVTPLPPTHNSPQNVPEKRTEMLVVSEVATRYDEAVATPLLTQREREALLGSAAHGGANSSSGGTVAAVSETTPMDPRLEPVAPPPPRGGLLAVGTEAVRVGREMAQQAHCPVATAESLLEATLISANNGGLILVDAGAEYLEAGVRALRGLNPEARLILVCEPADEVACRQALKWGADDYEIVPLDRLAQRRLAAMARGDSDRKSLMRERLRAMSGPAGNAFPGDMPAIPLLLQTEVLEEIIEGGGVQPDFAERATAALARRLGIGGTLRFVADTGAPAQPSPGVLRRAVAYGTQAAFGELVWMTEQKANPEIGVPAAAGLGSREAAGMLAQAGNWLGAMLALAQRYEQMRLMAITDELSGAYNRRYFIRYMEALLERARANRSRVTLLLFDIDDFKRYNDTFGHASGDAIIRELIQLLRACTRPKDLVARIGGDEFAVVYWDNEPPRQANSEHPKEIVAATERFREAIRKHQWPETCRMKGTISISGGLATFPQDAADLVALMRRADEALLKAKAGGKNVIVLHGEEGK